MTNEQLAEHFEISADRVAQIKAMLSHSDLVSSCVLRTEVVRKALDPDYEVIFGSNTTVLKAIGFLDAQGQMPEDVRALSLRAFGLEGTSSCSALEEGSCPYPQPGFFDD